jgi:hypothetical protein
VYLLDVDLTSVTGAGDVTEARELHDRYLEWHERRGNDPRIGHRLGDLGRAAGLTVVEHRGWTVRTALSRGMRGPAWAARDELVRAGLAVPADVRRWDRAFVRLDTAPERPEFALDVFAAVCRRPA